MTSWLLSLWFLCSKNQGLRRGMIQTLIMAAKRQNILVAVQTASEEQKRVKGQAAMGCRQVVRAVALWPVRESRDFLYVQWLGLLLHLQGAQVPLLVREPRSRKPRGTAKKFKKINEGADGLGSTHEDAVQRTMCLLGSWSAPRGRTAGPFLILIQSQDLISMKQL